MKPQVYDSADPNLPNLPDTDQILWSDYDDYLSNYSSSASDDNSEINDKSFEENQKHGGDNHSQNPGSSLHKVSSKSSKSRTSSSNRRPSLAYLHKFKTFSAMENSVQKVFDSDSDNDSEIDGNNKRKHFKINAMHPGHLKAYDSENDEPNSSIPLRDRAGSILSYFHLSRRKSSSNSGVLNNTKQTGERKRSSAKSSILGSPIIQPTVAHSIAAGETKFREPTFSYDEEKALGTDIYASISPESYSDLDVTFDDRSKTCKGKDSKKNKKAISRINTNKDSDHKNKSTDEDIEDSNHSSDNLANTGYQTDYYSNYSKKVASSHLNSSPLSNKVAINEDGKKVLRTDTDVSDFRIPYDSYQPQGILRKKVMNGTRHDDGSDTEKEKTDDDRDRELDLDLDLDHNDNNNNNDNDNDEKSSHIDFGALDEENDEQCCENNHEGYEEEDESDNLDPCNPTKPPKRRSRRRRAGRRRRRKSRKYAGSQSKKERTAWEPGIDLRTTNVFLNSPGSIITITDYSKTRYRISHYDLFSEMNPKYSRFMTDDTILSANDFNFDLNGFGSDSDSKSKMDPEFNDFMEYMNKVSDSHYEVEEAIKSKPAWSEVRWINVNGLSWEAISIIGKKYNLHPLSVEDLVDIPQRTKMDIYQQHLFVVMPLLKLLKVKRYTEDSQDSYFDRVRKQIRDFGTTSKINKDLTRTSTSLSLNPRVSTSFNGLNNDPKIHTHTIATREQLSHEFSNKRSSAIKPEIVVTDAEDGTYISMPAESSLDHDGNKRKVTQKVIKSFSSDSNAINPSILPRSKGKSSQKALYGSIEEYKLALEIKKASIKRKLTDLTFITGPSNKYKSRMEAINRMRPLMSKSLAVGVEQVSLYLTSDGTVLSFFEHSAMDIERAILSRLSAEYTILRETCNSSILFHSVLDANVDLLYPVVTAYSRILNEKELEILTASLPDLQHTQELHLMLNELSILKNSILPVSSLIQQLKDLSLDPTTPFIDENCKLYLADISDHILAFIDEIDSMKSTIENLIDLIFNTLSVETNNSMQQLSLVSVLFLPLTFWAGYFGMNFKSFGNLDYNVSFFWALAVPFTACMMIILMRKSCWRYLLGIQRMLQRNWIRMQVLLAIKDPFKTRQERKRSKIPTKLNTNQWERLRKLRKRD